ncbi:F-box protein at5g49610 [Phtheirospermum japonicum]|uniref:F-box protein at5g49610 n=1 Tax=Phtheirospermum japonicum TaxID=374723 RepID=A0A830CKR4_9LAMI|nr:F-box protein at5g49610 [Phtheirospermum japonicum]
MLKTTNIESLPDEIIFDILVRVPAQDIYDATRLVCRKWYKIIHTRDFIRAHLQQSTCGLLAQYLAFKKPQLTFIATGKGQIEISKLNHQFRRAVSSCNGLVLEPHDNHRDLHITNPATKQHFALPPFLADVVPYWYAIAYAATSMEYKVVRPFFHSDVILGSRKFESQDDCVAILTAGVDKDWTRCVNTQHLSDAAKELLGQCTLTTEGFVHWTRVNYSDIFTLNVETEVITQSRVPSLQHDDKRLRYYYLAMGSYLSLLIAHSYWSWEVWEMRPETGEWTHMPNIDVEPQKVLRHLSFKLNPYVASSCWLVPVGWSNFREVLVFQVDVDIGTPQRFHIAYNVRTQEIDSIGLDFNISSFLVHRNSLVWLDGW